MKQLYIVGILIAVVLLILTGLSKFSVRETTLKSEKVADTASSSIKLSNDNATATPVSVASTTMQQATQEDTRATTPVVLHTSQGDITIELYTKEMPITAGNFLKLVKDNFYDSTKFHRVIDGFMIQGGDPLTKDDAQASRWGTGGPGYTIPDEFGPRYSNARGTISMANAGPNTGGSQFFINTVDNVFLDGKHPVFGRIVSGMEVVDTISKTKTGPRDVPVMPVTVRDVEVR